jgi:hypothetical protein
MLTSPPRAIAIVEATPDIGAGESVMYPRLRWPYCATLKADPVPVNTQAGSDSSPMIDTRIADPTARENLKPFHRENLKPFHRENLKPFHRENLKPFHRENLKPFHRENLKPLHRENL